MTQNQEKLIKILKEMFQLYQSDLDFGIYRIMNTKSKEISEFLENDLLSSVQEAFSSNDNSATQKELDELIQTLTDAGINPDDSPKVQELKEKLSSTSTSLMLENEVFSHLTTFFSRYYKDGDFVSLRRYKKDTYAIPYEGEEVKLHWANSDQYYIKSGEYFRDYTFKSNGKTIHLKLSDAETESNNNKATGDKERRFVILESNPCEVKDDELYINFEYKAVGKGFKQDKLNEEAIIKALENIEDEDFITALNTLAPTQINKKRTIFEKHLKNYTSRNSFDYFIHKDLGGFLNRELDFYIKNEMLFLDDIMDSPVKYDEVMGKIKIFKEVAQKIIAFLTGLEELQKKLWEKKKFVIETNYCITLDKIDESYYEEIFANKEQLAEWKKLFDVDVKSVEELKKEKYLVLDTKFFDMKFKYKLLSEFDNLDEVVDGVLINSENFGALNLLQSRYKEQVKTVYIDPPYNTGNDGFLYNDSYQHSSWMSFMYDRLAYAKELMNADSIIFSSIDEKENHNLNYISRSLFIPVDTIKIKVKAQSGDSSKLSSPFTDLSEYINLYSKNETYTFTEIDVVKEYVDSSSKTVNQYKYLLENIGKVKNEKSYSFDIDKGKTTIDVYEVEDFVSTTINTKNRNEDYYISNINSITRTAAFSGEFKKQFNMKKDKVYYFSYILTRGKNKGKKSEIYVVNGEQLLFLKNYTEVKKENNKNRLVKIEKLSNLWTDLSWTGIASEGNVELKNGKKPERLLERIITLGSDNKSNIILDFFAGSGTTPSVAHKMNKKYIGIEMGEYFDILTIKRMKYTLYGNSGGLESKKQGGFFKYFKLESYEDTLNNLEFKKTEEQQQAFDFYPQAKEDYMLNYSLDYESQDSLLNIDTFKTPFDYRLKIATSSVGETKETAIDLVETFNYLLGLVVKRIELLKGYLVVEGQNLKGEKILIIWRDGQSSDELNEFFNKMDWSVYDREFDTIYVNGDNNLANLKKDEDNFKVKLIEEEFKRLMFDE